MKVRVDVCVGQDLSAEIDTAFLEKRESWLPGTGIYLEFILKGIYNESFDFKVESDTPEILVTRHSWNRFFINIQQSGNVDFKLVQKGTVLGEKAVRFKVAALELPLLFSCPDLLCSPVSDIRFFANRISENLVNGTRFSLFTTKNLEGLRSLKLEPPAQFWKVYELILSILTERGLKVYITPFDYRTLYSLDVIAELKPLLFQYIEKSAKFRIVWDFSSGIRRKELGGLIDGIVGHFGSDVKMALRADMFAKVGGEGFAQSFVEFRLQDKIPTNERGVKIARIKDYTKDYFVVREFTKMAVSSGWGVEVAPRFDTRDLKKIQYSLSRSLYMGYCDATLRNESK